MNSSYDLKELNQIFNQGIAQPGDYEETIRKINAAQARQDLFAAGDLLNQLDGQVSSLNPEELWNLVTGRIEMQPAMTVLLATLAAAFLPEDPIRKLELPLPLLMSIYHQPKQHQWYLANHLRDMLDQGMTVSDVCDRINARPEHRQ